MVNLPPGRLIPMKDESNEVSLIREEHMFPQLHMLLPVGQEVCDPPAWGRQAHSAGCGRAIVYRPVGSVGRLQGVQEAIKVTCLFVYNSMSISVFL